jgi:lactoylglutathione lyase
MIRVNAYIVWTPDVARAAAFYRALGVALVDEQHDDGPVHAAADVAGVHVAIYPVDGAHARAPGYRTAGGAMLGVEVPSLAVVLAAVGDAPILRGPEEMPWGRRVVLADPDGRAVEVTESADSAGDA